MEYIIFALVNKNLFRKETNEFLYGIAQRLNIPEKNQNISVNDRGLGCD